MRTVEALTSGRFKVRYRVGTRQSSQTFDARSEAIRFAKLLDAFEGNAQAALDQLIEEAKLEQVPTLNELAEAHIEHLTGVEHGTRLKYRRLWARTWGPEIGHIRAHHLVQDDIRRAVNALGDRYALKSLENQRGLLSGVMDRAVEKGYLIRNPVRGIRLPRGQEADAAEMRIFTKAEFNDAYSRFPEHTQPLVHFLVGTGARWGEAVALDVSDWQRPNVRIRRALKWSPDNNRTIGPTKTKKSNRTVAVDLVLADVLDEQAAGHKRGDFMFTAPRGGMVLHRTFWSRYWLPAVEHLEPRPRIHDLRHTAASWALAAGVPIHIVSRRLGHESIQTTVDTYGHLLPDAQALAAQAAEIQGLVVGQQRKQIGQ